MPPIDHITLTLDRALLEHPRALHFRRMRSALWLYLVVLSQLPGGTEPIELDPAALALEMGLPEGTLRSWLGHLRKGGYLSVQRLNGHVRVSRRMGPAASKLVLPAEPVAPKRFFTPEKLARALGDSGNADALQAAINLHGDEVLRSALARALAVPENQIRRSRTALFLYFLKRHAYENAPD
jgi:hypothetical protein